MNEIGDENMKLEQENERIVHEMTRFREEYKKKFKDFKKLVGDHSLDGKGDGIHDNVHNHEKNASDSKTKLGNSGTSNAEKEERLLQRQNQLEQTIGGLLQKYYSVSAISIYQLLIVFLRISGYSLKQKFKGKISS